MVGCRLVVAVVHNVTAATRMVDVLAALESDLRVQVVFTVPGSSPFAHGLDQWFTAVGAVVVPWEQATRLEADLVVSASHGGELHAFNAPLVIFPHGIGYNKYGSPPKQPRPSSPAQAGVFGLSAPWLIHQGRVVPDALVLSHTEQVDRLKAACPEAVGAAVVAGDPCLDRMAASEHLRGACRAAFGVGPGRRLVVVNSTWGSRSLFGTHPHLIHRLLAELPLDGYQVVAALHPNIWHGHSPWQVRESWLAEAVRSGLVLAPPFETWRAALVGADVVIGDHSSVTFYAAALGRPVLLAADHPGGMDPASAVARFCEAAPRLRLEVDLAAQVEAVIADPGAHRYAAAVADATSAPGEAAALIRALLYRTLGIPQPPGPAVTPAVDLPTGPEVTPRPVTAVLVETVTETEAEVGGGALPAVHLRRYPAVLRMADPPPGDTHLLVDWTHRDPGLLALADVVMASTADARSDPAGWAAQVFTRCPGCLIAGVDLGDGRCLAYQRGGPAMDLAPSGDSAGGSGTSGQAGQAGLTLSGLHGWLAAGSRPPALTGAEFEVQAGPTRLRIRVRARQPGHPDLMADGHPVRLPGLPDAQR